MSVSYLGLTREAGETGVAQVGWQDWYRYFPWEDRRAGVPALLDETIAPRLAAWCEAGADQASRARAASARTSRWPSGAAWNGTWCCSATSCCSRRAWCPRPRGAGCRGEALPGEPMRHDHRRILATGIARLRAKIKYRPVVFELMPAQFTLLQLQQAVEALAGRGLHKQNFRRLIEQQDLVEETGDMASGTAGRPAKLFRFRRDVLLERAIAGSKLPLSRGPREA